MIGHHMNPEHLQYLVPYLNPLTQCMAPDCKLDAVIHVIEVNNRVITRRYHLCEHHSSDYQPFRAVGDWKENCGPSLAEGMSRFDFKFIVLFDKHEGQGIYLQEVLGSRTFSIPVGIYEATSIISALHNLPAPRPLTHSAIALIIAGLGGKLEEVIVDEIDDDRLYHAYLRIRQGSQLVSVDVRVSDAFALAALWGVPILISDNVLERAAELRWDFRVRGNITTCQTAKSGQSDSAIHKVRK